MRLNKNGKKVKKISFIGYSLGGLIVRYAIGLLGKKGLFDTIEPDVSWHTTIIRNNSWFRSTEHVCSILLHLLHPIWVSGYLVRQYFRISLN